MLTYQEYFFRHQPTTTGYDYEKPSVPFTTSKQTQTPKITRPTPATKAPTKVTTQPPTYLPPDASTKFQCSSGSSDARCTTPQKIQTTRAATQTTAK